ncbi:hypothetical protein SUGI_1148350 [Cryptomeria japonica]|nr:hypothetical protein SUGI_1148350 [Cryptomeria japonica]
MLLITSANDLGIDQGHWPRVGKSRGRNEVVPAKAKGSAWAALKSCPPLAGVGGKPTVCPPSLAIPCTELKQAKQTVEAEKRKYSPIRLK